MRVTRYDHSCLLVEQADARLLIDPGTYSRGFEDLTGLTGILITHQHPDHLDMHRFPALLAANPGVPVYADPQTAAHLDAAGVRARAVRQGDVLPDVGTEVTVHGHDHAVVHADVPVVDNVSYVVGGRLLHPGDALCVPDRPVEILAIPAIAPWMAAKEAVDYYRRVNPKHAFPIHTALASHDGLALYLRLLDTLGPESSTFHALAPRASREW